MKKKPIPRFASEDEEREFCVPVDTLIEKYLSEKILEERDIIESDTPE